MGSQNYEPLASEWGRLFSMTLDIKIDGPFKRRLEDLTREVGQEAPHLPPIMWGIVLYAGFMLLRMAIRSEGSFMLGLKKLVLFNIVWVARASQPRGR